MNCTYIGIEFRTKNIQKKKSIKLLTYHSFLHFGVVSIEIFLRMVLRIIAGNFDCNKKFIKKIKLNTKDGRVQNK